MTLSGVASASDFFDSTLTIQGKTLDLGEAGRTSDYAVFTTNGTFSASTSVANEIDVEGNVGVNGLGLTLSSSVIHGNATLQTGGTFNVPNASQITGTRNQGSAFNTKLNNGTSASTLFSSNAAALTATTNFTASSSISGGSVILNNSSLSITASDSQPVVLKLSDFVLNGGNFTLVGTAMSKFIIDVSGNFNLSNASQINLSGGLLAGNVVFNVTGGTTVGLSGASRLDGILLAANRTVTLTGAATINGELIGKSVALSGGSKVKKPTHPSP